MIGRWKIGAQISTSHSSRCSLDPTRMLETVRRVQDAIDLDLLMVGFRESPEIFGEFCGSRRPIDDTHLWYSALSDIEGMDQSDLVVDWRGERSRGWGGWTEKSEVEETFRFACPNNPNVRRKTVRRLRELLTRYDFAGVFLDKIRFPSPASCLDEMLSCFCGHCRDAAARVDLDLNSVIKIFAERAIDPCVSLPETEDGEACRAGATHRAKGFARPAAGRAPTFTLAHTARFPASARKRCKRRSLICVDPGGLARSGCVTNCIGCMACGFPRRRFTKCSCSTDSVFCRHANAHVTSRNATTGRYQVIACRWIRARSDPVYTNSPPSMIAAGSLSPA